MENPFLDQQLLEEVQPKEVIYRLLTDDNLAENEKNDITIADSLKIDRRSDSNFDQVVTDFTNSTQDFKTNSKIETNSEKVTHLIPKNLDKIMSFTKSKSRPKIIKREITGSKSFNYFVNLKKGKKIEKSSETNQVFKHKMSSDPIPVVDNYSSLVKWNQTEKCNQATDNSVYGSVNTPASHHNSAFLNSERKISIYSNDGAKIEPLNQQSNTISKEIFAKRKTEVSEKPESKRRVERLTYVDCTDSMNSFKKKPYLSSTLKETIDFVSRIKSNSITKGKITK